MIDATEVQIGPVDLGLLLYARKQAGCRTLIDEIYGIGPLTSVAIVAELAIALVSTEKAAEATGSTRSGEPARETVNLRDLGSTGP